MWGYYCRWQDHQTHEVEISYPDSFDLRDYAQELQFLQQVKASGVRSATLLKEVDKLISDLVLDDEALGQAHAEIEESVRAVGQFAPTE